MHGHLPRDGDAVYVSGMTDGRRHIHNSINQSVMHTGCFCTLFKRKKVLYIHAIPLIHRHANDIIHTVSVHRD